MTRLFGMLLLLAFPSASFSWFEGGHHVIAVMAYDLLEPTQQQLVIRLLKAQPNFATDFIPPLSVVADERFLIGTASYWPDVARRYPEWTRPNWHYELGSTLVIGSVANVPQRPGSLPLTANLDTQDLYISQALQLCRNVLADATQSDRDKALAICWLCHLVGDSHQPCHAGSLYVESVFPEGDRGANGIPTKQGDNMHAFWDGLLGQYYDSADIDRRVTEMTGDTELVRQASFANTVDRTLDPATWLNESREASRAFVYAPEVLEPISVAMRSQSTKLVTIELSDEYVRRAERVAQLRATQAAFRLARLLQEIQVAVQPAT